MALIPQGDGTYFDTETGQIVDAQGNPIDPDGETASPTFVPGGSNVEFFETEVTDVEAIIQNVGQQILRQLILSGNAKGQSPLTMTQFWEGNWTAGGALGTIDTLMQRADREQGRVADISRRFAEKPEDIALSGAGLLGASYYTQTIEGFNELTLAVWDFYGKKAGFDLGEFGVQAPRGGGRRGPTAADIRGQFDLDELTEAGNNIWRGMLLTDEVDTRSMAKAYIDAVVAGKGKQKIDFVEFIRSKAMATDRFASIYPNLPPSMSPEQYMAPYFQSALQVAASGDAANLAIGGAQFGASSQAFAARLRRDEAVTGSSPFINELQGRLADLNRLFRG